MRQRADAAVLERPEMSAAAHALLCFSGTLRNLSNVRPKMKRFLLLGALLCATPAIAQSRAEYAEWHRQEAILQTGQLPPDIIAHIRALPSESQHQALTEFLHDKELVDRLAAAERRVQDAEALVRQSNRSLPVMAEDMDTGHTLLLMPLPGQLGR